MVKLSSIKHMKCSKNVSKIFNPYNIFPNVTPGKIQSALKDMFTCTKVHQNFVESVLSHS